VRHGPACSCTPWLSQPSAVPVPGSHLPMMVGQMGCSSSQLLGLLIIFHIFRAFLALVLRHSEGLREKKDFSCSLSIVPPSLNRAFQIFQPGLVLSPELLPAPDLSPGQSLFGVLFSPHLLLPKLLLIPKYHFFFPLFLASNKLYIPADLQTQRV